MDLSEKSLEDVIIEIDKLKTDRSLEIIKTVSSLKVLWPGVKAWFDDVYKTEYISTPILIDVEEAFDSEEEAEDCCNFIKDLIAELQLKVALKITSFPEVTRYDYKWFVNTSFMIHKPVENYIGEDHDSIKTVPSSTAI